MKKQDFFKELAEYLEFENVNFTEKTDLTSLDGFDSMAIMSLIAFCDEEFNKKFSAQQLQNITTVRSLIELIGIELFED